MTPALCDCPVQPLPRAKPALRNPWPPLQAFLTKLLTIDLPALMILPKRLEINIPPAVTAGGAAPAAPRPPGHW